MERGSGPITNVDQKEKGREENLCLTFTHWVQADHRSFKYCLNDVTVGDNEYCKE